MKKLCSALLILAAAWCSPLLAQPRDPQNAHRQAHPSLHDAIGFKAPKRILASSGLGTNCSSTGGTPRQWISDGTSTAAFPAQYPATTTVFSQTFTSGALSRTLFIQFWAWVSVPTTATGFPDGIYMLCTVTQGAFSTACPGTEFGPALLTQTGSESGLSIQASYNGSVCINPGTSTRVDIQITTLSAALTSTAAVNSATLFLQH